MDADRLADCVLSVVGATPTDNGLPRGAVTGYGYLAWDTEARCGVIQGFGWPGVQKSGGAVTEPGTPHHGLLCHIIAKSQVKAVRMQAAFIILSQLLLCGKQSAGGMGGAALLQPLLPAVPCIALEEKYCATPK